MPKNIFSQSRYYKEFALLYAEETHLLLMLVEKAEELKREKRHQEAF